MIKRKLKTARFFEFPPEVVAGGMNLSIYENIGVSVENYGEILNYSETMLRFRTERSVVRIEGDRFCIMDMDADTFMASGSVNAVIYEKDERE